jgi:hypothetical protein
MITAIYTGHAPVRGNCLLLACLKKIQSADAAEWRQTVQHIVCRREALAGQRYDVFEKIIIEPKDISTASIRELCFFIRSAGLLRLC